MTGKFLRCICILGGLLALAAGAAVAEPPEPAERGSGDYPQPLHRAQPEYPRAAALRGVQGCVTVAFDVRPDGLTDDFEVLDSQPPGVFVKSALLSLRDWRYPERDEPLRVTQTIEYTLVQSGNPRSARDAAQAARAEALECEKDPEQPQKVFVRGAEDGP